MLRGLSHPSLLGLLGFSTDSPRRPGQTGVPGHLAQYHNNGKQMPKKPHVAEGYCLVTSQVHCFLDSSILDEDLIVLAWANQRCLGVLMVQTWLLGAVLRGWGEP